MVFQTSPSMPKRSKAAQSRANNLLRGRKILQTQQDNARVIPDGLFPDWCQLRPASCDNSDHAQQPDSSADDWAFDTETDNSFEWLDEESTTEIDSEEEQSDPRDITDEAQLLTFIQTLQKAHEAAQLAANEQNRTSRKHATQNGGSILGGGGS
jgi:hypothetical protein